MDLKLIDELVAKSTPEWAAKRVGSGIGHAALKNADRVPNERKNLEQPPHKPKDPVLSKLADRVQKVGEHMRSHYKMKPGEFEKYQNMAHQEANRVVGRKSFDETTAEYFVKCHSHVLDGVTEENLRTKKKQPPKAEGHVFGNDTKDKRGSDMEMVEKKEPEAYKSLDERTMDYTKAITGSKRVKTGAVEQREEDLPYGKYIQTIESSKVKGGKRVGSGTDRFTHTSFNPEKGEVKINTSNWNKKKQKYEHGETTHPTHVGMGSLIEANKDLPRKSLEVELDSLLEKGRLRQVNKVKEGGAASGVRRINPASLSLDRQQQLLSGSAAKVKAYRTEGYMPDKSDSPEVREQDKDPSNKSMTSMIDEIIEKAKKPTKVIPFNKLKTRNEHWLDKHEREKEAKIERGPIDKGDYIPGSKTYNNPGDSQDPKIRYGKFHDAVIRSGDKSLDDRTCDLIKSLTTQKEREIKDAGRVFRLSAEGLHDEAKKISDDVSPETMFTIASKFNGIKAAREAQKSVIDKWQASSSFVTKGSRVMPLGPGGMVSDLSKDEDDDEDDKKDD